MSVDEDQLRQWAFVRNNVALEEVLRDPENMPMVWDDPVVLEAVSRDMGLLELLMKSPGSAREVSVDPEKCIDNLITACCEVGAAPLETGIQMATVLVERITELADVRDRAAAAKAPTFPELDKLMEEKDESNPMYVLINACESGDVDTVALQLGNQVDLTFAGGAPLCSAARCSNEEAGPQIIQLLVDAGADVNADPGTGFTPLVEAAGSSNAASVQKLLDCGARADYVADSGGSAIYAAAEVGSDACVKLLLAAGAPAHHEGPMGATPLHAAANRGCTSCVTALLDAGAELEHAGMDGRTALMIAASESHLETLTLLLQRGADATQQSESRPSALACAISSGSIECVELLRKHGADLDGPMPAGLTALMIATTANKPDILEYMLEQGQDIHAEATMGMTALSCAINQGAEKSVRLLLERHGGNVRNIQVLGKPMVYYACEQKDNAAMIEVMVEAGADLDAEWGDDVPITIAAKKGHVAIVEALEKAGVPLHTQDRYGVDLLFVSVVRRNKAMVEWLLQHDIRNIIDNTQHSVRMAAQEGEPEMLRMLLDSGFDANCRDIDDGVTPLLVASECGNLRCVEVLLEAGADHTLARHMDRVAPLHMATVHGHPDIIRVLLAHGANPDQKRSQGVTPLFLAASEGLLDEAEALLEGGADARLRVQGLSPLEIARMYGDIEMLEIMDRFKGNGGNKKKKKSKSQPSSHSQQSNSNRSNNSGGNTATTTTSSSSSSSSSSSITTSSTNADITLVLEHKALVDEVEMPVPNDLSHAAFRRWIIKHLGVSDRFKATYKRSRDSKVCRVKNAKDLNALREYAATAGGPVRVRIAGAMQSK